MPAALENQQNSGSETQISPAGKAGQVAHKAAVQAGKTAHAIGQQLGKAARDAHAG